MVNRTIDLDSFFVSDEQVLNSKLKGKPVVVGGNSNLWGSAATVVAIGLVLVSLFSACINPEIAPTSGQLTGEEVVMKLPEPEYDSNVSLEQSLLKRRSIRSYSGQPVTLQEISQLLWAAQGITDARGLRTAPSAGALYPLELYIVVGNVQDLAPGVYHYQPGGHQVAKTVDGDIRVELASAALDQESVEDGAVAFVFTAVYERTTGKYGDRGIRYVHMEVGHAAQNICLQATARGLGAVTIGAFHDKQVATLLGLSKQEQPLYIIPVGME